MTRLLDPLLDADEGGSSPRRRSLAESMIARRRKATDQKADEKESAGPRGGRRRRSTPKSADEPAARDTAKSDDRSEAKNGGREAEGRAPAARRRRRPATDRARTTAARTEASEETEEPAEEQPAAVDDADVPQAITGGPDNDGQGTLVERAMRDSAAAEPESPPEAAPATADVPRDLQGLSTEVTHLRSLVEQQRTVLAELRAGILTLGRQVDRSGYRPRLGVFVDVPNLIYGFEGDKQIHMGKLLDILREGRQLVRATAYSPVSDDPREPLEQQRFVAPFVPYDYRIVTKPLKRFADGSIKGNFDVEMAIDMLLMADRVDVVAIVSGDADFARAVEAVQSRGVRVEVVAFAGSTSLEMRAISDHYIELSSVVDQIT